MGDAAKGPRDEEIFRHDLAHHGRAKTSALLVGTPFGYAFPCAEVFALPNHFPVLAGVAFPRANGGDWGDRGVTKTRKKNSLSWRPFGAARPPPYFMLDGTT